MCARVGSVGYGRVPPRGGACPNGHDLMVEVAAERQSGGGALGHVRAGCVLWVTGRTGLHSAAGHRYHVTQLPCVSLRTTLYPFWLYLNDPRPDALTYSCLPGCWASTT